MVCLPSPAMEILDFKSVLAYLVGHQYSGWIVVEAEQDPKKYNPLEYAQKVKSILMSY